MNSGYIVWDFQSTYRSKCLRTLSATLHLQHDISMDTRSLQVTKPWETSHIGTQLKSRLWNLPASNTTRWLLFLQISGPISCKTPHLLHQINITAILVRTVGLREFRRCRIISRRALGPYCLASSIFHSSGRYQTGDQIGSYRDGPISEMLQAQLSCVCQPPSWRTPSALSDSTNDIPIYPDC